MHKDDDYLLPSGKLPIGKLPLGKFMDYGNPMLRYRSCCAKLYGFFGYYHVLQDITEVSKPPLGALPLMLVKGINDLKAASAENSRMLFRLRCSPAISPLRQFQSHHPADLGHELALTPAPRGCPRSAVRPKTAGTAQRRYLPERCA